MTALRTFMSPSPIRNPDVALFLYQVTIVGVVFVVVTVENIGGVACSDVTSCNLVGRNYFAVCLIYTSMGGNSFAL